MIAFLAWAIASATALPFIVLALEGVFGLAPIRGPETAPTLHGRDIAILIPAHNEATGLGAYLTALQAVRPDGSRVLLVADNCTDSTVEIARGFGIEVIERQDTERRGKAYALAYGRDHLAHSPPTSIIILDADCLPEKGAVEILADTSRAKQRPVQASNLLIANLSADPRVQMSNFAFWFKNHIRTRGMMRISGASLLLGTGMALPWSLFKSAELETNALAEDAALGIDLMQSGHCPLFCETARVTSPAASKADTITQRTRWEHGFIDMATRHAVPLVLSGIRGGRLDLFWTGLHLLVPALALLSVAGLVALTILVGIALLTKDVAPAVALGGIIAVAFSLVGVAWLKEGRAVMSGRAALSLPLYVLWKLPVYLRLFGNKETNWIRTKRPGE
jgi:cellulose synthase/poly-beta-1,6-N-acetylglucosamine synthase-like glycosyltransferase